MGKNVMSLKIQNNNRVKEETFINDILEAQEVKNIIIHTFKQLHNSKLILLFYFYQYYYSL